MLTSVHPIIYIRAMEFFDKTREWSRTRKRIIALRKRGWAQVKIAAYVGKRKQFVNKVLREYEKANPSPQTGTEKSTLKQPRRGLKRHYGRNQRGKDGTPGNS